MTPELVAIEVKKILFYRGDLLMRIVCSTAVRIVLGYYLWKAIFAARGVDVIQGYTFGQMMVYYVLAALVTNAVVLPVGTIAKDIYDGSLTKFIVLPVSFFWFRAAYAVANCLFGMIQIGLGLLLLLIIDPVAVSTLSSTSIALGIITIFFACLVYYAMLASIELLGLWVEQAASLSLGMLFLLNLVGGVFIPLSVFPIWAQSLLFCTPFPYLVYFPAEMMRGVVAFPQVLQGWCIMAAWFAVFRMVSSVLWRRGSYHYAGVGM